MTVLAVVFSYLLAVLILGAVGHKLFRRTGEDYFVATRSIGPFVLLMSLFGTHMTVFSLLGASGEAYHRGIAVFALMASSSALIAPLVFFFIGTRLWALGKRHGYLTQIEYFRERWDSNGFALLLFVVLVSMVVPYLLIGLMGGGLTLSQITHGRIPEWAGSLLITLVVCTYVGYGGMRSTAWVNTFQTLVFMSLGLLTFVVVLQNLGGLTAGMTQVAEQNPDLLVRGERVQPLTLLTYSLIPLSAGMFPHIFSHWLTARRGETFRYAIIFYPLCIAAVWVPSVLLGILGRVDFPNLDVSEANSILIRMIDFHAPEVLAGLLAAGVLAAVMSSLDSQVLSVGTMFTQQLVHHYRWTGEVRDRLQVRLGRAFIVGILLLSFVLSLFWDRSIFKLGVWSFTGFASLFPVVVAALYWKRSTKYGAVAAVITVVVLWIYFLALGLDGAGYTLWGTGILPVALIFGASAAAMLIGSWLTSPPDRRVLEKFFPTGEPEAEEVQRVS